MLNDKIIVSRQFILWTLRLHDSPYTKFPLTPYCGWTTLSSWTFWKSLTFKTVSRQFEQKKIFRAQRQDYCQPTVRPSNNHADKGSLRPTQVCSNGGVWCIRNFLSSFIVWCRGQYAVSKTRHCFKPKRWAQTPRDRSRLDIVACDFSTVDSSAPRQYPSDSFSLQLSAS